ncbi:MAG: hypothetical protein KDC92_13810, partial [Bacteroidetes bacterium]|nr:hypothetical protein [Bacteroidota bacterium]
MHQKGRVLSLKGFRYFGVLLCLSVVLNSCQEELSIPEEGKGSYQFLNRPEADFQNSTLMGADFILEYGHHFGTPTVQKFALDGKEIWGFQKNEFIGIYRSSCEIGKGIVAAGYENGKDGKAYDQAIMSFIDADGNEKWTRRYILDSTSESKFNGVFANNESSFYALASQRKDFTNRNFICKVNMQGDIVSKQELNPNFDDFRNNEFCVDNEHIYLLASDLNNRGK